MREPHGHRIPHFLNSKQSCVSQTVFPWTAWVADRDARAAYRVPTCKQDTDEDGSRGHQRGYTAVRHHAAAPCTESAHSNDGAKVNKLTVIYPP